MRATEFLVENRTQWWRDKYAKEIYNLTMSSDNTWFALQHRPAVAPTGRVDPKLLVDSVVEWIEALDPTPNKKYTGWLIREYATGAMPQLEDVAFLGPLLGTYDRIKQRPDFPFERDILKIDSSQLFEIIDWWDEIKPKKALTDRGQSVEIDNNDEYRAIMPTNQAAACYYGQGTRWCTGATESHNYFAQYNKQSPLLILLPKEPQYEKEKYQLHFAISISAVGGHYTTELTDQDKLEQAVEADPDQWQIRWGEFSNDKNQNVGLREIFDRFGKETVMNTLQRFGEEGGSQLQWQIRAILDMYSGHYSGLY